MEAMCSATADAYGVYDASEGILIEHFARVLRQHEIPSFFDFAESLSSENVHYGGRKQGYLDTLNTRKIKTILSMGSIIDCRRDMIGDLYDKNVVFEIGEISGAMQYVLTAWLSAKLMLFKRKNPTPYISHVLVIDEGQGHLVSRNLELRGRTSSMATFITQCRAFGLGVVVLAQNPTKLMTEIIGNSSKICMHLGSGIEIQEMSKHLGLTFEQMETMYRLNRQQAICRLGHGYMEPTLVDIMGFADQPVNDAQLQVLMGPPWDRLLRDIEPARPQVQLPASARMAKKPTVPEPERQAGSGPKKAASGNASELRPDELSYLRIVSSHPFRLLTEVYELLSDEKVMGTQRIGQATAVRIRKKLIKLGYLESVRITGTGKSGRSYSDIATEKANMGTVPKPRGDLLHAFWCHRISEFFRSKGATVKIGETVSGNEVDISVEIDDANWR